MVTFGNNSQRLYAEIEVSRPRRSVQAHFSRWQAFYTGSSTYADGGEVDYNATAQKVSGMRLLFANSSNFSAGKVIVLKRLDVGNL